MNGSKFESRQEFKRDTIGKVDLSRHLHRVLGNSNNSNNSNNSSSSTSSGAIGANSNSTSSTSRSSRPSSRDAMSDKLRSGVVAATNADADNSIEAFIQSCNVLADDEGSHWFNHLFQKSLGDRSVWIYS